MLGNPRRRLLFTALVAALAIARLPADDKPKSEPAKTTASRIQKKTYNFEAAAKPEMEYALFVPSTYDKSKKTPLVVALHGLGSTAQVMIRYPGLTDLAEKYGFIVVAPMGYNSAGWYGQKPPFGREPVPANTYELSEQDVMNVLEIVRKDFTVDPARIYLMGHSMGGGGTVHLALKHPELWAALAPIAPAIFHQPSEMEKIKHIPMILVQGDNDNLVRVERVRPWAEKMKELKMTHEYLEIAGGGHVDVAFKSLPKIFAFFQDHKKTAKNE